MGRVEGKVAFVTGAGRGQGRSHAVQLAAEGADIIAVDICQDYETVRYPMASSDDLKETARLVEQHDRRIVALQADVRDRAQLTAALEQGVAELGRLDVVVANAGIAPMRGTLGMKAWVDGVDTMLIGTINAVHAALPYLNEGASIMATGSSVVFIPNVTIAQPGVDPGGSSYGYAKIALTQFITEIARQLGPRGIRANVIHPCNVNTGMLQSQPMYESFRPDLEHPTREDAEPAFPAQQLIPVPWVEPEEISNVVVYLASDESKFVTGMQMRVDAGSYLKFKEFSI